MNCVPGFHSQAVGVFVTVQSLSNAAAASLSYNRPSVFSISPNTSYTDGGILVHVEGMNFGQADVPLAVSLVRAAGVEYACEVMVGVTTAWLAWVFLV